MSDYISRDFMKSLGAKCIAVRDEKTNELIAITGIDELPSEDVQPVVRCGKCAYFRQHREQSDWCVNWNATVDDIYGFCSEGKRRGDNNEID